MAGSTKRILVVGAGAREHALADGIRQDPGRPAVLASPGNPGMEGDIHVHPSFPENPAEAAVWIDSLSPDLVVIGPEKPLAAGLSDALRQKGRRVLGPSAQAAQIESSKLFAKERMREAGIPTADFFVTRDPGSVRDAVRSFGYPSVLKADGLAQGKGVFVLQTPEDLEEALGKVFHRRSLGDQTTFFVERGLSGPEVSFIVLTDGTRFLPFPEARDYKRIGDGNRGPNTGGMGAVTPLSDWTEKDQQDACHLIERILWGMRRHGTPFQGFLYAGLMKTAEGLKILEFNARFGDPEAQVLLPSAGESLLSLLEAAVGGSLPEKVPFSRSPRVAVVLAAQGYPEKPVSGHVLSGLGKAREQEGTRLYMAGVGEQDGQIVSSGGRVLTVAGEGKTMREARERAYQTISMIGLEGGQFRTDIGAEEMTG